MPFQDDAHELSDLPSAEEVRLMDELGQEGLRSVDESLIRNAAPTWLKVARVVVFAMRAGRFPIDNETQVALHVRRVIALADIGALEARGNLRKPRWSEVRLPGLADVLGTR